MKKSYDVIWAERAEKDLYDIVTYIAKNSPTQAKKILTKIKKVTSSLFHQPMRGRIIPELREQGILQYRELIIPPWRVMYRISEPMVFVVSVIDSRRNLEDILLERLISFSGVNQEDK